MVKICPLTSILVKNKYKVQSILPLIMFRYAVSSNAGYTAIQFVDMLIDREFKKVSHNLLVG